MTVDVERIGKLGDLPLYIVNLKNRHGMRVRLLNYGATVMRIYLPKNSPNESENVVLSFKDAQSYITERHYLGSIVGRVAGRLPTYLWKRGERLIALDVNEGKTHKHGGSHGLDRQVFSLGKLTNNGVSFIYLDRAGNNGYPGNLKLTVRYVLNDNDQLKCTISARTDEPTLFNPTNHTYFDLDGEGVPVTGQRLTIMADLYQPVSVRGVPERGWHAVSGTPFDLRKEVLLSDVLGSNDSQILRVGGINHAFLINQVADAAVRLRSTDKNRTLTMITDAPAVVIYSGNHFPVSRQITKFLKYGGLTMEAQVAPEVGDDWSDIVLEPGERFERNIQWTFEY